MMYADKESPTVPRKRRTSQSTRGLASRGCRLRSIRSVFIVVICLIVALLVIKSLIQHPLNDDAKDHNKASTKPFKPLPQQAVRPKRVRGPSFKAPADAKLKAANKTNSKLAVRTNVLQSPLKHEKRVIALLTVSELRHASVGTWIIQLASAYALARKSQRKLLLPIHSRRTRALRELFHLANFPSALHGPGHIVINDALHRKTNWTSVSERHACAYDQKILQRLTQSRASDFLVRGSLLSYKYFQHYATDLRKLLHLHLHPAVSSASAAYLRSVAQSALASASAAGQTNSATAKHAQPQPQLVFVGVHIRRGNLEQALYQTKGHRLATAGYLYNAMHYMLTALSRAHSLTHAHTHTQSAPLPLHVAFVVCSDSVSWFDKNFDLSKLQRMHVNSTTNSTNATRTSANVNESVNGSVTMSVHNAGKTALPYVTARVTPVALELSILAHCNHTIMTVGTFGYSAAFLAGGVTTYYNKPFTPGSLLARQFRNNVANHYLPDWVPLGD